MKVLIERLEFLPFFRKSFFNLVKGKYEKYFEYEYRHGKCKQCKIGRSVVLKPIASFSLFLKALFNVVSI